MCDIPEHCTICHSEDFRIDSLGATCLDCGAIVPVVIDCSPCRDRLSFTAPEKQSSFSLLVVLGFVLALIVFYEISPSLMLAMKGR